MNKNTSEYFDKLFRDRYSKLVSISYRYTERRAVSEEVVQDIFVDFWGRLQKDEPILDHNAYLNRAVVYRSLDIIKRERKYKPSDDSELEALFENAEENSASLDFFESKRLKLKQAVSQLPERTREVFQLSKYENYTHNDISNKLEITKKTVEYHITKALLLIRKALICLALWFF